MAAIKLTDKIVNALLAGANPNSVRVIGALYEYLIQLEQNYRFMTEKERLQAVIALELKLTEIKIFKERPLPALKERIATCHALLDRAFELLTMPRGISENKDS